MDIREVFRRDKVKFILVLLCTICIVATSYVVVKAYFEIRDIKQKNLLQIEEDKHFTEAFLKYDELNTLFIFFEFLGIDSNEFLSDFDKIKSELNDGKYSDAMGDIDELIARMNIKKESLEGIFRGKVADGSTPLKECLIQLLFGAESKKAYETQSNEAGEYKIKPVQNTYTLKTACAGYDEYSKEITIVAGEEVSLDQNPAKIVVPVPVATKKSTPAPAVTSNGDSTANSSYVRRSIDTASGTYTIDLMTFNLGSGGIRVVTDTASDDDCADSCPTTSLANMVARNGGFAGIHGTYFCPADYASCAGQTNSFFWKILNPRVGRMINSGNGLGEYDDYYTFSASGYPTFFGDWITGASGGYYSGINSGPALVKGGASVLNWGILDDKQKYTKSNRGAIGLTGSTFFAMIASSATVPDTVDIMLALGCNYATEIDGGGSVAMYYNGSYRKGPGRSLPNGIVFVGN